MKHLFCKFSWVVGISVLLLSFEGVAQTQGEGVGINTTTIDPRSVLHIENTYDDNNLPKGLKLPSYDASEIANLEGFGQAGNALNRGLLLFSNENNQIYQVAEYDFTPFIEPIGWGMHGNALSDLTYGSFFIGSTDFAPFSLGTDNTERMTFMETGEIVIGSSQSVSSDASFQINGTKGLLLPRLTASERLNIQSPTPGLFVYDTDYNSLYVGVTDIYGNSTWSVVGGGGGGSDADWTIGSGTIYNTTDNVGIGTSSPSSKLHVFGDIGIGNDGQIISDGFSSGSTPRIAYGYNTDASGGYGSVAIGWRAIASGIVSVAFGINVTASGYGAVAMGENNTAAAQNSAAFGKQMSLSSTATNSFGIGLSGTHSVTTPNVMSVMGGNVGIGTTSPSAQLHVDGGVKTSRLGTYGTYSSTQVQGIWSISENYLISTANDNFGTQYGMGYAYNQNGGSPFASEHQIVFTNNGTINAAIGLSGSGYFAGDVGIGITSPLYKLHVEASVTGSTNPVGYFRNTSGTSGSAIRALCNGTATGTGTRYGIYAGGWYGQSVNYGGYLYGYGGTTSYGVYGRAATASTNYGVYGYASGNNSNAIYSSGNQTSTTSSFWTYPSDRKMKNNIRDLNVNAMETISKFKPKTFFYKHDKYPHMELPNTEQWGFIAQEIGDVMPEMMRDIIHPSLHDEDGNELHKQVDIKGLNLDRLLPLFVKAFQEQQKMMQEQQEEIDLLKKEIEYLKDN